MKTETLDSPLQQVINMPSVAFAHIWRPTPEEVEEYAAAGVDAKVTLEVTLWRSARGSGSSLKSQLREMGLRCIGTGWNESGPCFTFIPQ